MPSSVREALKKKDKLGIFDQPSAELDPPLPLPCLDESEMSWLFCESLCNSKSDNDGV